MAVARHYSDLTCWKLGDALRTETLKLTRREPWQSDHKHRFQAEDAVDSVCRNIAEGFGCETHGEFAQFLRYSRRSLNELGDCFTSAQMKRYVQPGELDEAFSLRRRLYPALNNFIAYLERTRHYRRPRTSTKRTDQRQTASTDERQKPRTDKR